MNDALNETIDTGYQRPRDPVEIWLARQWQRILGFARTQKRLNGCDENRRVHRFHQVAVGAAIQPFDLLLGLNAGC